MKVVKTRRGQDGGGEEEFAKEVLRILALKKAMTGVTNLKFEEKCQSVMYRTVMNNLFILESLLYCLMVMRPMGEGLRKVVVVVVVKLGLLTQGSGDTGLNARRGLTGSIANLMPMTWRGELPVRSFSKSLR